MNHAGTIIINKEYSCMVTLCGGIDDDDTVFDTRGNTEQVNCPLCLIKMAGDYNEESTDHGK